MSASPQLSPALHRVTWTSLTWYLSLPATNILGIMDLTLHYTTPHHTTPHKYRQLQIILLELSQEVQLSQESFIMDCKTGLTVSNQLVTHPSHHLECNKKYWSNINCLDTFGRDQAQPTDTNCKNHPKLAQLHQQHLQSAISSLGVVTGVFWSAAML